MSEFAHPLVGSPPLPVAPAVLAAVTAVLVAVLVTRVRSAPKPPEGANDAGPRWHAVTRALAAALFVLLVLVARFGPAEEPGNLAAVSVLNLVWPILLGLAALFGAGVWRALDPWRALGSVERLAAPAAPPGPASVPGADPAADPEADSPADRDADPPVDAPADPAAAAPGDPPAARPGDPPADRQAVRPAHRPVWVAAAVGAAWALFLVEYAVRLDPRALATALVAYTLLLVAGSVAVGRDRWLGTADAIGLLVSWTGRLRRGGLRAWSPPPGAAALLGGVFGGTAFARLRLTTAWGRVAISENGLLWTRLAGVASVLVGAGLAVAASAWARRRGAPGSVEAALVPVVAALSVARLLRRSMIAVQLLPSLLTDPFGKGWRLLGGLGDAPAVDVNPLGTAFQQALAWSVMTAGALAGGWVLARRVKGVRARDPAAYLLYAAAAVGALAVTLR